MNNRRIYETFGIRYIDLSRMLGLSMMCTTCC